MNLEINTKTTLTTLLESDLLEFRKNYNKLLISKQKVPIKYRSKFELQTYVKSTQITVKSHHLHTAKSYHSLNYHKRQKATLRRLRFRKVNTIRKKLKLNAKERKRKLNTTR